MHMFEEILKPKRHEIIKSKLLWFSLRWDDNFLRNIVVSFGVIFVRVGAWWLIDKYIIKWTLSGSFISIAIWIFLLFIIDGDVSQLWWYKKRWKDNDKSKDII